MAERKAHRFRQSSCTVQAVLEGQLYVSKPGGERLSLREALARA